jgi:hypothetical protein
VEKSTAHKRRRDSRTEEGWDMFGRLSLLLLILTSANSVHGQCLPAPETRVTDWGHENVVSTDSQVLRKLSGVVLVAFSEVKGEDVLVEVFDHPELVEDLIEKRQTEQKRLVACVTQKDGKFSFDLPAGKYELRCSKPVAWKCSSVVVTINRKGSSKHLKVTLQLAD